MFEFNWRTELLNVVRQIAAPAFSELSWATMPWLLVETVEGRGTVGITPHGINIFFDPVRHLAALTAFTEVSDARPFSHALYAAVETRLESAARDNSLVMTTCRVTPQGARGRVYLRFLAMTDDEFRSVSSFAAPSRFLTDGGAGWEFAQAVLRAECARFDATV